MADFKLNITADATKVIEASAKAAEALKKTAESAKESSLEAVKAVSDDGKETEESAKKTAFLSLKKGDLRKVVRQLSSEFPLAGQAAKAMMNPILATVTIGISLFGKFKQSIDEWNRKMDEVAERNANRDFLPGLEAQTKAMGAAAIAAADFQASLDNVAAAEDRIRTATQQATDKLREFSSAQGAVNAAREARDLAAVDLEERSGKISETQAARRKFEIKENYRKAKETLQKQTEEDELRLLKEELEEEKNALAATKNTETMSRQRAGELRSRLAKAQEDQEKFKENGKLNRADYDQKLDALSKAEEELSRLEGVQGPYAGGAQQIAALKVASARAAADESLRRKQLQELAIKRNQEVIDRISLHQLPAAEAESASSASLLQKRSARIAELESELPRRREILDVRQAGRREVGDITGQTERVALRSDLQTHLTRSTEEQKALLNEVSQVIERGGEISQLMVKKLREYESKQQEIQREIANMNSRSANRR